MNILVDIRCLLEKNLSGVGEYTRQLLNALFFIDKDNAYYLFSNAFGRNQNSSTIFGNYPNVRHIALKYPNKLLNLALCLRAAPMDKLAAQHCPALGPVDLIFLPNGNFWSAASSVPLVVTAHDLSFAIAPEFFSFKERLWHSLVSPRRLLKRASRIISVSLSTKNDLVNLYGLPEERVSLIYPGVEKIFSPQAAPADGVTQKKLSLPPHFILSVGTFSERKNTLSLINVFRRLKKNGRLPPDVSLVLVGSKGTGYQAVKNAAAGLSRPPDIFILDYVPRECLPALYRLAAVFVYPSFYEGFGFPPLEALASGTPVITSSSSSLPEVVGDAGILVNPYNEAELEAALEETLSDTAFRTELSRRGLARAAGFSWERAARETLRVFKNAALK